MSVIILCLYTNIIGTDGSILKGVCLCVYVFICMHVSICIYIYIYIYISTICWCMCMFTYFRIFICLKKQLNKQLWVYTYVWIFVHSWIYIFKKNVGGENFTKSLRELVMAVTLAEETVRAFIYIICVVYTYMSTFFY
jgi:hypothetical protein